MDRPTLKLAGAPKRGLWYAVVRDKEDGRQFNFRRKFHTMEAAMQAAKVMAFRHKVRFYVICAMSSASPEE